MLRKATLADAGVVASDLRLSDQLDLQASTREPAQLIIERAIFTGPHVLAVEHCGTCIAVGGVTAPRPDGRSVVWMLGTSGLDAALDHGGARLSKTWLHLMSDGRPSLFNIVPASNTRTVRWLKWLGFQVTGAFPNFRGLGHDCLEMTLVRLGVRGAGSATAGHVGGAA